MEHKLAWVSMGLLALMLSACSGGKQSAVEGILMDWNGKPVPGVKITASQVQPIKGYEQLESVTKSDGAFRLTGLFPSSQYVLKPLSDKWSCETAVRLDAAPQGETALLPSPMVIAQVFTNSAPRLIADIATGAVARSAVEGKLVDWNGKPVAGVKIVATQERPIKGYKQFERMTTADGSFCLPNLLAMSKYVLKPSSEKWNTETSVSINSPEHHGDSAELPSPMVIRQAFSTSSGALVTDLGTGATRFMVSSEGVITDSETGLDWAVGPDRNTNYAEAEQWVAGCNVAGWNWRMPTREELRSLYFEGIGERNMDPVFKTTGWYVWAEPRDSSSALYFYFRQGNGYWGDRNDSLYHRVFGVHSRPRY